MDSKITGKLQVKINGFWQYVQAGTEKAAKVRITDRPEKAAAGGGLEVFQKRFPKAEFRAWTPQPLNDLLAARNAANFRLALSDHSPNVEIEVAEMEKIGFIRITFFGSENLYFTAAADGNDYFCKCL